MRYVKTEDQAIRESSWGRIIQHMEGSDTYRALKTGEYPTDVPVSLNEYLKGKK